MATKVELDENEERCIYAYNNVTCVESMLNKEDIISVVRAQKTSKEGGGNTVQKSTITNQNGNEETNQYNARARFM